MNYIQRIFCCGASTRNEVLNFNFEKQQFYFNLDHIRVTWKWISNVYYYSSLKCFRFFELERYVFSYTNETMVGMTELRKDPLYNIIYLVSFSGNWIWTYNLRTWDLLDRASLPSLQAFACLRLITLPLLVASTLGGPCRGHKNRHFSHWQHNPEPGHPIE